MGKRIELIDVYRPTRKPTVIAKLKTKVEQFNAPVKDSRCPNPPLIVEEHRLTASPKVSAKSGSVNRFYASDAQEELARRRALKAAQMRRYRANKKAREA